MRAALYYGFGDPITVENVADPTPASDGVVIEVKASDLCRSDWHGWMGNDSDIMHLPHVPGHEFAGVVVDVGARVIAVDIAKEKLELALSLGAHSTIDASEYKSVVECIQQISNGGPHVSIDALGSLITCQNSISCLRKGGKHIQVGLLTGDESRQFISMDTVVSKELQIIGSHGMQAHRYPDMLKMILSRKLLPEKLVGNRIYLDDVPVHLTDMADFREVGVTVIDKFR